MKLWLVRHAQPLVDTGICYGRLDLPADACATAKCARQLAALLPAGLTVITSPLQRCEQLRHALRAERPDLAYKTDTRLQEMDFGDWEGRAWNDIDRAELDAWTGDFANHSVGHGGESVTAFMRRVASAFDALGADMGTGPQTLTPALFHREREPTSDTVWITHAGVIRAACLLAKGVREVRHASQWPLQAPEYGQWRLVTVNEGP